MCAQLNNVPSGARAIGMIREISLLAEIGDPYIRSIFDKAYMAWMCAQLNNVPSGAQAIVMTRGASLLHGDKSPRPQHALTPLAQFQLMPPHIAMRQLQVTRPAQTQTRLPNHAHMQKDAASEAKLQGSALAIT